MQEKKKKIANKLFICATSTMWKSFYTKTINDLWNTPVLAYLRSCNLCQVRPDMGLHLKRVWGGVVLQVLEINHELLQAIRFRNGNVTRGFLLARGKGETWASTPGKSIYQQNCNYLTGQRRHAGTRQKKKIQYYCCPSNLSLFPLNLISTNTDLFFYFIFGAFWARDIHKDTNLNIYRDTNPERLLSIHDSHITTSTNTSGP